MQCLLVHYGNAKNPEVAALQCLEISDSLRYLEAMMLNGSVQFHNKKLRQS